MALGVFVVAAVVRSDVACRPITFDEADYALAAARGFVTNWLDRGDVNLVRHFHGPLLVYLVDLAVTVGGWVEAWIRAPLAAASALACATVAVAAADLTPGTPTRRALVALAAGLLLATAPASVTMSSFARPQPLVELLLVLGVWLLCRWLRRPSDGGLVALGAVLGLQLTAMEYGYVVAAAGALAVVLARTLATDGLGASRPRRAAVLTVVVTVLTVLVAWPPGLLEIQSWTNLRYYVEYAERGQLVPFRGVLTAHVPWWAYAYWYWTDYPLVLLFALTALGGIAVWMWRARTVVALVTGTFAAITVVAVHRAHIMTMAYSSFAVPPLVLAGVLAMDWGWHAVARAAVVGRVALRTAVATVVVAAIAGGTTRPIPHAVCTTDSALERVSRVIARDAQPDDAVLATQWPIVHYVTALQSGRGDVVVAAYDPTSARRSRERYAELEAGRFAWVLLGARASAKFPDTSVLRYVQAHWQRVAEEAGNVLFRNPARP